MIGSSQGKCTNNSFQYVWPTGHTGRSETELFNIRRYAFKEEVQCKI